MLYYLCTVHKLLVHVDCRVLKYYIESYSKNSCIMTLMILSLISSNFAARLIFMLVFVQMT